MDYDQPCFWRQTAYKLGDPGKGTAAIRFEGCASKWIFEHSYASLSGWFLEIAFGGGDIRRPEHVVPEMLVSRRDHEGGEALSGARSARYEKGMVTFKPRGPVVF
ncbi:hypothetical protein RJJ11_28750 [Rhizobium hidalgonense]|nr:hypothetical protein [Rhizobium hidalgonense]MDR9808283.1 hypothetical protein [Rhizobium hidalgonense]